MEPLEATLWFLLGTVFGLATQFLTGYLIGYRVARRLGRWGKWQPEDNGDRYVIDPRQTRTDPPEPPKGPNTRTMWGND